VRNGGPVIWFCPPCLLNLFLSLEPVSFPFGIKRCMYVLSHCKNKIWGVTRPGLASIGQSQSEI
jgi:hypothetical protein